MNSASNSKTYYQENRARLCANSIRWGRNHPEKVAEKNKEWRSANLQKAKDGCKKWRDGHKEYRNEYLRKWRLEHPEKARGIRKRRRAKLFSTPVGVLNHHIGVLLRQVLRENKKGIHWESLLGYTVIELKNHLESKFLEGMTWARFLSGEIHIDHIIPMSRFNYNKPEDAEFKVCWGLSNLQPLWAIDNLRKGNRMFNGKPKLPDNQDSPAQTKTGG